MSTLADHYKVVAKVLQDASESLPAPRRPQAQAGVPAGALKGTLDEFKEFLDHNELELAWDALAAVAERTGPNPVVWFHLAKAADMMGLTANLERALRLMIDTWPAAQPGHKLVYFRRDRSPSGRMVWRRQSREHAGP